MSTLYEDLGHGTFVALHEKAGTKLTAAMRKARPAASHRYQDCRKPYKCLDHKAAYRRILAARKREREAAELHLQNLAAMARVAAACRSTS